ncbi:hypothetical protein [Desulfurispora thermophila]|nr:hypothetical protein [Desulfurispora thermophila]
MWVGEEEDICRLHAPHRCRPARFLFYRLLPVLVKTERNEPGKA